MNNLANQNSPNDRVSRRGMLQTSVAGAALLAAWPSTRSEAAAFNSSSDRPILGAIGVGGRGTGVCRGAARFGDFVAVCDVDSQHAARGKEVLGGKADVTGDYRHVIEREDVDAVVIGTPDHWHAKIAAEALAAGKHVYCEKPLTLTIEEGKLIRDMVAKTGRTFQVGTQQRTEMGQKFLRATALCREGRLGDIHRVTCAIGGAPAGGPFTKTAPPSQLDWNMWLGQTPEVDYIAERSHGNFRWWYEYSGGKMTDWGAHHVDIAHWAMEKMDEGPVEVYGAARHPAGMDGNGMPLADDAYNTATQFVVFARFADGKEIVICDRAPGFDNGLLIEGDKSRIFVSRGRLTGRPVEEMADAPIKDETLAELYKGRQPSQSHIGDFFHCLANGAEPVSDVASHHRSLTTCHLANISIRLGRPLRWDPKAEQIIDDEAAAAHQAREVRSGFEIDV